MKIGQLTKVEEPLLEQAIYDYDRELYPTPHFFQNIFIAAYGGYIHLGIGSDIELLYPLSTPQRLTGIAHGLA